MAAAGSSGAGALLALLAYCLLLHFVSTGQTFYTESGPSSCNRFYSRQLDNIHKHFGYGKYVLFATFCPCRYFHTSKYGKTTVKRQSCAALVIAICLLLSGDIHQCPGPVHTNMAVDENTGALCQPANPRRNNTVFQVSMETRDSSIEFVGRSTYMNLCPPGSPMNPSDSVPRTRTGAAGSGEPGNASGLPGVARGGGVEGREKSDRGSETTQEQPAFEFGLGDQSDVFKKKGLHFMHLNARSILPKIDEIRQLISKTKVGVFCISESWLDSSVSDFEIEIENYSLLRKDRNRNGGGVCVYIRLDLHFSFRPDLVNDNAEILMIDICLPRTKPILLGVCYRAPQHNSFYDHLENVLLNCPKLMKNECILIGDFNTDALKKACPTFKGLDRCCRTFGLTQLIQEPTRICDTTQSTIDLILVSDPLTISQSGVLIYGISDHFLTYCTRKLQRVTFNSHKTIKIRSLKNYNADKLREKIQLLDWSPVLNTTDINMAWDHFKHLFISVIDMVAPTRSVRIKQRSSPWFNSEIAEVINVRDKSLHKYKQSGDPADFLQFKKFRNEAQRRVKEAKKKYLSEQIRENKDNPQNLWKVLKSLGCATKPKSTSTCSSLYIDGKKVSNKDMIANHFNIYFTSVAQELVRNLPPSQGIFGLDHCNTFYSNLGVSPNSFLLKPVSVDKIGSMLKDLNIAKATGLDNISARYLKDAADLIAPYIAHVTNLSLEQGIVPSDMKHSKVIPLFKKGTRSDPGNYRPVSILSVTSKILERVVHEQLYQYINDSKLMYKFQSGFRKCHSTDSCLLYLTDFIRGEMDAGKLCGMILIDLQKAFDTVDHSLLFNKLSAVGMSPLALEWFVSYLSDRHQWTEIQGHLSREQRVTCGIPQGSVLGPLLFLIYINDMQAACYENLFLYADDSAIIASHKDETRLQDILSEEFNRISDWLVDNKLSLHVAKTEYIVFGSQPRLRRLKSPYIDLGGQHFTAKSSVSYLGCLLDNNLGGESMALSIMGKVNGRTRFLARKAQLLDSECLRLLANSLVSCCFDYAMCSWYEGLTKALKDKLQTSQNKLIRVVLGLEPRDHVGRQQFQQLGWLPLEARSVQLQLRVVHNVYHNRAPEYLGDHYKRSGEAHGHYTRASQLDLCLPRFKTNLGKCSNKFSGAANWNRLPPQVKAIASQPLFKKKVKTWLLDNVSA